MASSYKKPAIKIQNLETSINGSTLHKNLSLQVDEGEIFGVVGASGAGKSPLLRVLLGLTPFQKGTIEIFGKSIKDPSTLALKTGVLFQTGALFSSLTVLENILFPLKENAGLSGHFAEELGMKSLKKVGLERDVAGKMPSSLSGGMIKRVGLARALAIEPRLLFLDEPTAGLDPISANELDILISSLSHQLGLTVFMVTHDLDSMAAICHRIDVLRQQKLVVGTLKEVSLNDDPWIQSYFRGVRGHAITERIK